MYDIKKVVQRMQKVVNLESNIQLAKVLNVSYNTFNTWIKRGKLPQEVIIEFSLKYNISLDYLLFEDNSNKETNLFNSDRPDSDTFEYFGNIDDLKTNNYPTTLHLDNNSLHSGGIYLICKDSIYSVVRANFDIFSEIVELSQNSKILGSISLFDFKKINMGLIVKSS